MAKLRCEAGNATFPHVNSVEDLDFYTQEIDDRATWVQERSKILKVSTEKTPDKEPWNTKLVDPKLKSDKYKSPSQKPLIRIKVLKKTIL